MNYVSVRSLSNPISADTRKIFSKHKRPVGRSWYMDETFIKVKGFREYLYRTLDKQDQTVDFLLTAKRDKASAK